MRTVGAALALVAACMLPACSRGLSEEEACKMAKEYLLETKKAGWQVTDPYRYPPVAYKNLEVLECFDFTSDNDRGWAKIRVRAVGDQYHADEGSFLGRGEFEPTLEFDRYDQGWKIAE